MLLQSGNFRLKGKKALLNQAEIPVRNNQKAKIYRRCQ